MLIEKGGKVQGMVNRGKKKKSQPRESIKTVPVADPYPSTGR